MNEQHGGTTIRLELAGGPLDGADIEVPIPAPKNLRLPVPATEGAFGDYRLNHAVYEGRDIWWYQDPALLL